MTNSYQAVCLPHKVIKGSGAANHIFRELDAQYQRALVIGGERALDVTLADLQASA